MRRRRFIKLAGLAAGSAVVGPVRHSVATQRSPHSHPRPPSPLLVKGLTPFVDALPIPPTMPITHRINGVATYDVAMVPLTQQLHRDLAPTTLWGYHGACPGPTIEARSGVPIRLLWRNNLPSAHALQIDTTIHGAEPDKPAVRTVVHVHGLKVLPDSDGYPDAWFTTEFARTGPFFKNRVYEYPNDQRAATLWYHDHTIGITRLNIYMGLAGLYILRDDIEDSLTLPSGMYEIPLVIQDRNIAPDGSLVYPAPTVPPIAEFFGESVLVNGKIWPYLTVEPRKYRFRILNASNARFYRLRLVESDEAGNATGHGGPSFVQIGSDGGLLSRPVSRASIDTAPGERLDVIVDFADHAGNTFVLANDAPAPFPEGGDVVPPHVMMFRVARSLPSPDLSSLPNSLPAVTRPDMADVVRTRDLVLSEVETESHSVDTTFISLINKAYWHDPITERPTAGSTEIWRIINRTDDAHPMHVHLVQFQILDRQPFDVDQDSLVFKGPAVPPPDHEQFGLKDTVQSHPGEVVRLLIKFDLPTGTVVRRGESFRYTLHCHILEHEENQMMRPYEVVGETNHKV
ncbi:MAG TPA: multicopper oxidase [Vicinamibacterales bacterium]|nr:multicopper oxidase [Vicinamibacterales bacterium]